MPNANQQDPEQGKGLSNKPDRRPQTVANRFKTGKGKTSMEKHRSQRAEQQTLTKMKERY